MKPYSLIEFKVTSKHIVYYIYLSKEFNRDNPFLEYFYDIKRGRVEIYLKSSIEIYFNEGSMKVVE